MGKRGPVLLLGLALAACGIKGAPPRRGDPKPVSDLRVEGRDGAVRVSWRGRTAGGVRGFDVLRQVVSKQRTYFEKIGTLDPAGTRRYVFFDRSLTEETTYTYRVRPRRDDPAPDEIRFTGPQGEFTWTAPPEPPTGLKSQPLNAGVRLTWDPVPDADGYRVYQLESSAGSARAEPLNRGLIDGTAWTAVALADGRSLCYVVRAVKLPPRLAEQREEGPPALVPPEEEEGEEAGEGEGRATRTIEVPGDEVEAPTGAEVMDAAAQGITIPRSNLARDLRRAVSELAGEGPLPGIESGSSEETCATPGLTEPPPPPKRVRTAIVAEGISLTWAKSTGEDVAGYHVERADVDATGVATGKYVRLTGNPVESVGYVDRAATRGARYRYQVRAVDSAGSEGLPSTPTDPIQFNPL